jgi:acyl-CoA synthetase (AMP-forming)/AMP-acid ligase II
MQDWEELTSDLGLWGLVENRAAQSPDAVLAVDDAGGTLTAAGLRGRAERVTTALAARGVRSGSVVAWQLPNWIDSLVLTAALCRLSAVQVPVVPILRRREVGFICGQAGAKLLVVPSVWRGFDYAAMAADVAAGQAGLDVFVADRALPEGDASELARLAPPPADGVRWCFYTSGTTAEPKGARHTDRSIVTAAEGMIRAFEITDEDRVTAIAPVTHIGGITCLAAALITGCRLLLVEVFDPPRTVELFRREGATLVGLGTPTFLAYLEHQRAHPELAPLFPRARAFMSGGAPKVPAVHHQLKAELGTVGIVAGYGLTECPMLAWGSIHDDDETLATTEGHPIDGVEIVVEKIGGGRAAVGEEGEIRVKAPQMMAGYVDPSLDAGAFDAEGWFRTGDLGALDEQSNIRITGRLKDVIVRNAENISAKELEDLLFTHPDIADVAVVGVPDPRTGERACAVVVPNAGTRPPTLDALRQHLLDAGLSDRKLPEQLEVVVALPRNPMGKVVKATLRQQLASPPLLEAR